MHFSRNRKAVWFNVIHTVDLKVLCEVFGETSFNPEYKDICIGKQQIIVYWILSLKGK